MPDYIIENDLKAKGYNLIAGVDEAGRGPLAGITVKLKDLMTLKS